MLTPIKTDEATGIAYRTWIAPSAGVIFLLVHGLGAHTGRWQFLAEYFLKGNVSSYAIELKGFGETKDLKGHIDSFRIYHSDILSLYNIIKKENPGKKIFILGESMGALIAFFIALERPELFNGLICISPAFKNRMKFSILQYINIAFALIYKPKKQFEIPFTSSMCTRDTAYQNEMDKDPREHRLATAKLLINIVGEQGCTKGRAEKLKIPALFLLAGQDELVDITAGIKVFRKLKIKDKSMFQYPDMRHALSIELGREKVFEDILRWVKEGGAG